MSRAEILKKKLRELFGANCAQTSEKSVFLKQIPADVSGVLDSKVC